MKAKKLDSNYWPDYLRMHKLWGKPRSEWPLSVEVEYTKRYAPEWAKEKAAYCDDNEAEWVKTVWMYVEWNNEDK